MANHPWRKRSWLAYACASVLVLYLIAAIVVLVAISGGAGQRVVGLVYLTAEAICALWTLLVLDRLEEKEAVALQRAAERSVDAGDPEDFEKAVQALTETLDAAYGTGANVLVGLGLIGSATVLLLAVGHTNSTDASIAQLLATAPKAFGATGFALCCSLIVAARGQWPFLPRVRAFRDDLLARVGRRRLTTKPDASGDSERTLQDRSEILGNAMLQSVLAVRELNARATEIAALLSNSFSRAEQQTPESLTAEAIINAIAPLTERVTVLTNVLQQPLVDGIVSIQRQLPDLKGAVDASRGATARLSQIMTEERSGLLERHAEVLREETLNLAREALSQLTAAAAGVIQIRLGEIAGKIERHAEEAYEKAYAQAAEKLTRMLELAGTRTRALADGLDEVSNRLLTVNQEVSALSAALDSGAQRVHGTSVAYREATDEVLRTLEALAAGSAIEADPDRRSLVSEMTAIARILSKAAERVDANFRTIEAERTKLAKIRQQLLAIAHMPVGERSSG